MTLMVAHANKKIFEFGERGDSFFFLMEGQADIMIPAPIEVSTNPNLHGDHTTICKFLVEHFHDIAWRQLPEGL